MGRRPGSYLRDSHPELAKELVDKSLLATLSTGSDKPVEWECSKGHRYFARPYNRTGKGHTGCPYCDGKKILVGFNDLATTRPDLVKYFVNPDEAYEVTRTSSKKVKVCCDKGHERVMPVRNLSTQGISCPYCSGRYALKGKSDLATLRPDLAAELVDQSLVSVLRPGSNRSVEWQCRVCGHKWFATVYDRSGKGNGCPSCSGRVITAGKNDLATVAPEYAATLVDPVVGTKIGKASETSVEWVCQRDESHRWYSTPYNRMMADVMSGCPICDNKKIIPGVNDLATTDPELVLELVDQSLATQLSRGSGQRVEWKCENGHIWTTTVSHRTGKNSTGCPVCNPTGTSEAEREFFACVKRLLPNEDVWSNDRSLLPGKLELDVVVPSRKMAFEFNGVRWHSEEMGRGKNYHLDKLRACESVGYRLVYIWEDDWNSRRDIVIRLVAAKLGVTANLKWAFPEIDRKCSERVFARKLTPCVISASIARSFMDANHIQGKVTATKHFALVDSDTVVRAVLSVRSPANNARMRRKAGQWEVQRYATCGTVVGGFSKLLAYAERVLVGEGVGLTSWISFSSNEVSDGAMYEKCGFICDEEIAPDYRYVGEKIGWYRHPKEQFQRKRFRDDDKFVWDESWTEVQAAHENGLLRVWDAGKVRWVKSLSVNQGACFVDVVDDVKVVDKVSSIEVKAEPKTIRKRAVSKRSVTGVKPGPKVRDLTGEVFGNWTVLHRGEDYVSPAGRHYARWLCRCACGNERLVDGTSLRHGCSLSCGCMKMTKTVSEDTDADVEIVEYRNARNPMSDELVDQLVDKSFATCSAKSHKKVEWECKNGHRWFADIASRTSGSGCPYCSGRLPVVGENDLATLRPDIAAQLVRPEEAKTVGIGSMKKLEWICETNPEHRWFAPVRNRVGTHFKAPTGCPYCSGHAYRKKSEE